MPQLPSINLTCDTVGVIQPAVTMTTSLQLVDALKLLTGNKVNKHFTYGDIWTGDHYTFGFSRMQNEDCKTCGNAPTYPHLNQHQQDYATLCGRDTVQYKMLIFLRKYYYHFSSEIIFNIARIYI